MIEKTAPLPAEDDAMDMKLSPEQLKLRSAARELAETEFAPERRRSTGPKPTLSTTWPR